MNAFINFFVILPVIGFFFNLIIPRQKEDTISWAAFSAVGLHLLVATGFIVYWLFNGMPVLNIKEVIIYQTDDYSFFIDFYFDRITATYLIVGAILTFLVTIYSRYYMHREGGYKRFFNTIQFFYLGYNVAIFSGNLETLFIGWEILGISSFLLIAFYRDRYLPVKNAVKVFSIYRIGDVGLILAMWMSHHLWHENITFLKLNNAELVHEHLQSHTLIGVFIALALFLSAAAKSAQLPFSSWLPRAMEGPTPSSAIFYGSLSVHLGVFLMLRTYPFWGEQTSVRIFIAVMGLFTSLVATGIARVQSSVKSQVAYASIAQIGLIFIEVAAGFERLALIHFAGNAFLRTYQLLVSPSVVSYLIREQFYNFAPRTQSPEDSLPKRLEYTLYMLCLKEWNIDSLMYRYMWNPIKKIGNRFSFLTLNRAFYIGIPVYLIGLYTVYNRELVPASIVIYLPYLFSLIALVMVLKAFTERKHARLSWLLVVMNHFWIALAISFNEEFSFNEVHIYLIGVAVAGILGFESLRWLRRHEDTIDLDQFHGHAYKHPKFAFMFLLACLGVSGFPITPTFVGEDLIFSHIHEDQAGLAVIISLSFIIDGLAIIRTYARVFLGPHSKSVYEMAYRSS
ncbi:MAG TPA: proton-conducting transporter membrane subunit [Cyclobacteriaceae bacterium]|nr:proton-conducting transporter membrane subunit [Cyclobacteriaceae bacterium]